MAKRALTSDKLYSPPGGGAFSTAIVAPPGRTIYVSGLTSRDRNGHIVGEGDIVAQTEQVLENLKAALEAGGATLDDVVKVTVFVTDMTHFDAIHAVRRRYFNEPYPASSMVQVSGLVDPRLMIEIEAVAVVPEK